MHLEKCSIPFILNHPLPTRRRRRSSIEESDPQSPQPKRRAFAPSEGAVSSQPVVAPSPVTASAPLPPDTPWPAARALASSSWLGPVFSTTCVESSTTNDTSPFLDDETLEVTRSIETDGVPWPAHYERPTSSRAVKSGSTSSDCNCYDCRNYSEPDNSSSDCECGYCHNCNDPSDSDDSDDSYSIADPDPDDMSDLSRLEIEDVVETWPVTTVGGDIQVTGVTFTANAPAGDDGKQWPDDSHVGEAYASGGVIPELWEVYVGREFAMNLRAQDWVAAQIRDYMG